MLIQEVRFIYCTSQVIELFRVFVHEGNEPRSANDTFLAVEQENSIYSYLVTVTSSIHFT